MKFIDLHAQQDRIRPQLDAAIARVLDHGQFVMGPEVSEFEAVLRDYTQAPHALTCANGTDALLLVLKAWGIGAGDAVFCPAFTFVATAEVVAMLGATPVFVDIKRDTYTVCPESLSRAIQETQQSDTLTPRALITVDLFGQPANYPVIADICQRENVKLIADSAQSFGCRLQDEHPLKWADAMTTSFFPAKPLGCYGDGGALMAHEDALAETIDSLRIHGKGTDKYDNVRIGLNSRLDSLQAAILLEKMKVFDAELASRSRIAGIYSEALKDKVSRVPTIIDGGTSTWAIYTIEVPDRERFTRIMGEAGIPTPAYYPKPLHRQTAYCHYPISGNALVNTDEAAEHVVSLPMHPYLSESDQARVIETACRAL